MLATAFVAAVSLGCGSGSSTSPSPPPQAPPLDPIPPFSITVTSAGVSPAELTIQVGSRVRFVNRDDQSHEFAGGPDPSRPDCREIDRAGFLAPGQSRDTGVFEVAHTCVYHDHFRVGIPAFEGRITIQ